MISSSEKPWYTPSIIAFLNDDAPRLLGIPPAAFARDVLRLEQRLACEGESFLTKTLPALGKAIDLALQGHFPLVTPHFKKRGKTSLPHFLGALTRLVFEDTGWLRVDPNITAIRLLRQICLWCKKVEKGYSDESLQLAIDSFKAVDKVLPGPDEVLSAPFLGIARYIVEQMFSSAGRIPIRPRHGPGAVASGEDVVGKRRIQSRSYTRLESVFRPIPWFFSLRDAASSPESVYNRIHCEYGLSRTEFVEKDSGGPRTIDLVPAHYMWVQQAVKSWMYHHIEARSLARGQVNFTDQSVNRKLALDPEMWETLDMSKASDRLSYALVRTLFEQTSLWQYLHASRTPGTVLPSGEILMYNKFSPMGSAVCFPVEACVFYAIACATLHLRGIPLALTYRLVFVYGDDLIVPRNFFGDLSHNFESVGLLFNADKCCTHGKFRESCGMDAFSGSDVTPVRMRKVYQIRQHTILPSLVQHANRLFAAGYWAASEQFRRSAMTTYPELRELGLKWTTDPLLPVLAWLNNELNTVKVFWKNQIPHIAGWVFKPLGVEATEVDEALFLRESLSLGGPVGVLRKEYGKSFLAWFREPAFPCWSHFVGPMPMRSYCVKVRSSRVVCRVITAKYSGQLRRKAVPYWPSGNESIVVGLIERLARYQK